VISTFLMNQRALGETESQERESAVLRRNGKRGGSLEGLATLTIKCERVHHLSSAGFSQSQPYCHATEGLPSQTAWYEST
jgi:hypothetical protein